MEYPRQRTLGCESMRFIMVSSPCIAAAWRADMPATNVSRVQCTNASNVRVSVLLRSSLCPARCALWDPRDTLSYSRQHEQHKQRHQPTSSLPHRTACRFAEGCLRTIDGRPFRARRCAARLSPVAEMPAQTAGRMQQQYQNDQQDQHRQQKHEQQSKTRGLVRTAWPNTRAGAGETDNQALSAAGE
jgi:hypothetical protein